MLTADKFLAQLKANGGPAFPSEQENAFGETFSTTGLTIRDWFAGHALPYITEFHGQFLYRDTGPRDIAMKAYEIADAMLLERQKP